MSQTKWTRNENGKLILESQLKEAKGTDNYAVHPGRHIYRNEQPFIFIQKAGDTRPTDADSITHVIAKALNRAQPKVSGGYH